jgi:hypothetical protein
MEDRSVIKRAYWNYLGRALAFAYFSRRRTFLGMTHSGWLKLSVTALFFVSLLLRLGWPFYLATFLLMGWLFFSYRRAEKMGYNQFVADGGQLLPEETAVPLAPHEKATLRASGTFALTGRENTLLLRPAEYWFAPMGDHVVMVTEATGRFLYQFFSAKTLQQVRMGWILFGSEPLPTLEVVFLETWGPEYNNNALLYFVGGGEIEPKKLRKRIIYLTFEDTAVLQQVWQTLVTDARLVRATMG